MSGLFHYKKELNCDTTGILHSLKLNTIVITLSIVGYVISSKYSAPLLSMYEGSSHTQYVNQIVMVVFQ